METWQKIQSSLNSTFKLTPERYSVWRWDLQLRQGQSGGGGPKTPLLSQPLGATFSSPRACPLNRRSPSRIRVFPLRSKTLWDSFPFHLIQFPFLLLSLSWVSRGALRQTAWQSSRDRAELRAGLGGKAAQTSAPAQRWLQEARVLFRGGSALHVRSPAGGPRAVDRPHSFARSWPSLGTNAIRRWE